MRTIALQLDNQIKAVCPILGVSIGDPENKNTWRIDFKEEATESEKAAAQAVLHVFVAENDYA